MASRGDIKFDEVQPKLKGNWLKLGFEETLDKTGSFTKLKSKEYFDEGDYPVIDQGDSFISGYVNDEKLLYKGELPVVIFGDHTRVVKYIDFEFATGADGTKVLKPFSVFDSMFFYYYMKSLKIPSLGYSRHFKILKQVSVPLPPLKEQQRIVAKLDTLFTHLEVLNTRLATIPQLLKNFKQAVLTQAVTGKLTEEWRKGMEFEDVDLYLERIYKNRDVYQLNVEKNYSDKGLKAPRKPSQTILDGSHIPISIPKLWKEVRLGDLIVDLTDYHANGSYVKLKANVTLKEDEDYACMIRSTNFEKNNFEDLLIYIDEKAYNFMHRSKLLGGEILISKIGNAGSVYFMPNLNRPASLAMNLFALRINDFVNNKFLYYYLTSNSGSKLINQYVRGVATKSIDKISVRSVMVGLPSIKEQTEIVKRVEHLFTKADKIEAQYKILKAKTDSLPQAILAKAFKGELLEQLDTDGSAKDLLAEIQKLKAAVAPKKKMKKKVKV